MKVIKADTAIKDVKRIAVVFTIDRRTTVEEGDKLNLEIVKFGGEMGLKEKVKNMFVVSDYDFLRSYLILEGETVHTCVDFDEAARMVRAVSELADERLGLNDFEIYLWDNDYPAVFIQKERESNFTIPGIRYGFAIAPIRTEEGEKNLCNEVMNR